MLVNFFQHRTAFLYYFKVIANSFAYLNSAVNPIIYALLNRNFRNNCENILSQPTCSIFCRQSYDVQQCQILNQQNRSHQSKNLHSAKEKNIIIDNNIPLSSHDTFHDDYADVEYKTQEPEGFTQVKTNKINDKNEHDRERCETLLFGAKNRRGQTLTTTL